MNLNYKRLKLIVAILLLLVSVELNAYACPLHDGEGAKATGENQQEVTAVDPKAPASAN